MSNKENNENELLCMLNSERETNGLYDMATKEIREILIEPCDYHDKVSKIANVLHRLTYDFGKKEGIEEGKEIITETNASKPVKAKNLC